MMPTPRPRLARACVRCAERKLRCNKLRPSCGRCSRDGLQCRYAEFARSAAYGGTIIDETQNVRDQMSLPRRLSRLGHTLAESGEANERDVCTDPQNITGHPAKIDPGHLYLGAQTKSTYFSPTFFASLGREVQDINRILHRQGGYTLHRPPRSESLTSNSSTTQSMNSASSRARNILTGASQQLYGDIFQMSPLRSMQDEDYLPPENMSLTEIAYELPNGQPCEALIRAYFTGYHTMKPLFNGQLFLQEARKLISWRDGLKTSYSPGAHFLALYAAVMFAGCVVCPRKIVHQVFGQKSRETVSSRLYDLAICAIRLADFPKSPSLWTFAAFLIINSTWLREEQPLNCCSFVGLAFRVAQMLGLHREPARFENLNIADVQVRRHLWWTLIALDAQIALASGLPPMIESKLYHIEQPDECNEVDIATPHLSTLTERSETVLGVFVGGRYTFYHQTSELLRIINSHRVTKANVDQVLKITQEIRRDTERRRNRIAQLAQITDFPQESWIGQLMTPEEMRQIQSSPVLAGLANSVLSMLAAKPYAIMYGPLRQHGMLSYLKEREPSAVSNCRIFLHEFLRLAQNQGFQPWHWCWPGQHQPLHSILALITELEETPHDPLSDETRKLVDLGLSMCENSRDGGITSNEDGHVDSRPLTDGGVEAWKLIRRARDEVWENSGLDSNSLYCPETAEDISFQIVPHQDPVLHAEFHPALDATSDYLDPAMVWSTFPNVEQTFWPEYHSGSFPSVVPE